MPVVNLPPHTARVLAKGDTPYHLKRTPLLTLAEELRVMSDPRLSDRLETAKSQYRKDRLAALAQAQRNANARS